MSSRDKKYNRNKHKDSDLSPEEKERTEERKNIRTPKKIVNISDADPSPIKSYDSVTNRDTKKRSNERETKTKIHRGTRRIYGYDNTNNTNNTNNTAFRQDLDVNNRIHSALENNNNGASTIANMFGVNPTDKMNAGNQMMPNQNFYNPQQFQNQMPYNQPMYNQPNQYFQQNMGTPMDNDEMQRIQNYLALTNQKNQTDPQTIAALMQQSPGQYNLPNQIGQMGQLNQMSQLNQMNPMNQINPMNQMNQMNPQNIPLNMNQTGGSQNPFFFR